MEENLISINPSSSGKTNSNNMASLSKYEFLEIVGEGSYGIVYKCKNNLNNEIVTIKRFKETEEPFVRRLISRELRILQMTKHENIVEYKEAFKRKGELFVVFEYVERNLLQILESEVKLTEDIIRGIIFELSLSICYLHSEGIIHRDIKPENLLITNNFNLKLCDFGLARKTYNHRFNKENLTDYVATRWYRAPEVILTKGDYGPEVDFWSIGCIMAEIITGQPLFPGIDDLDQLLTIQNCLGAFNREYLESFNEINPFINIENLMDGIIHSSHSQSLEQKFSDKLCNDGINLMKGLLEVDPKKRIKGEDVLLHTYFNSIRNKISPGSKKLGFNSSSKSLSKINIQANTGNFRIDVNEEINKEMCESQQSWNNNNNNNNYYNYPETSNSTMYKTYYKKLNLDRIKKIFTTGKDSKSVSNILIPSQSGGTSIFSYSEVSAKEKNSQKFRKLDKNYKNSESMQSIQNSSTSSIFPNNKHLYKYTAKLGLSSSTNQIFQPSKELQSQYKGLLNIRTNREVLKEHQKKFIAHIDKTNITIGKVDKFFTSSLFKNSSNSSNFKKFDKTQPLIKMSKSDLFKNKTYIEHDHIKRFNSNISLEKIEKIEKIEKVPDIKMTKAENFGKISNLNKILYPVSSQDLKNRIAFYYNKENEKLISNGPVSKNIPTFTSNNSNVSSLPTIKIKK